MAKARNKPNPRRANGTKRTALRNRVRAMGLPCALCHKAIDYSLPAGHPMSFELDEKIPVSRGGDPLDIDNVQPTHRCCNQAKGNRVAPVKTMPKGELFPTSRTW